MGGPAKHLTLHDKMQAQKAAKRKYAASDRGRQTKSEQNARTYRRRAAKTRNQIESTTAKDIPIDLPSEVITLAQQPMRSSALFQRALTSADDVDESDLGVWDARPPYNTLPAHQEDEREATFTEKLVQVMNGKRLRELRSDGESRYERLQAVGVLDVIGELEEQVRQLLVICRDDTPDVIASVSLPGSTRDLRMARLHYEWAARRLYCLHAELSVLRNDVRQLREQYSRRELAWQSVSILTD